MNKGKSALGNLLEAQLAEDALFTGMLNLLSGNKIATDTTLPRPVMGLDWERKLSAALMVGNDYGTRCSTIYLTDSDRAMPTETLAILWVR